MFNFKLLFLLFFTASIFSIEKEKILFFKSDITVNADATLKVHETIIIDIPRSLHRHGIVRDFPTIYYDSLGNCHTVDFTINAILKNNAKESYAVKSASNGMRIYIGDKDVILSGGSYTYEIEYTTGWQIGFFEDHDELYWNVTGNGSAIAIQKAQAIIRLPAGIHESHIQIKAYTGIQNARGKNYEITHIAESFIQLQMSKSLAPYEGITIAIAWPKGYIAHPSSMQKFCHFIKDNCADIWLLFGFFIFTIFCICMYFLIKKNKHTIIPLFYPPEKFTPGAVRYFQKFDYDATVFTAELINMAVAGLITIEHKKNFLSSQYILHKTKESDSIKCTQYYKSLLSFLFKKGDSLALTSANQKAIINAVNYMQAHLKNSIHDYYFDFHVDILIGALCIALLFIISGFFMLTVHGPSLLFTGLIVSFIAGLYYFHKFLKDYTKVGRKIAAEIDGFKLFLSVTEKERFKFIGTPPTQTPELYEKYLPYAVALGVEKQWAKQFSSLFAALAEQNHAYIPLWYSGLLLDDFNAHAFTQSISDIHSNTISSALNVPGSSSGMGDSGSSGGGGGGGSVGTW